MPNLIHNAECSIWQHIRQCLYILFQLINVYIKTFFSLTEFSRDTYPSLFLKLMIYGLFIV